MSQFSGFPTRTQYTPIPNVFFSSLLPQISDIAELKVTLHIFRVLYTKKGYPRFISFRELLGDPSLMTSIKRGDRPLDEVLCQVLELAVKRGTILHLAKMFDGKSEDIYFLNTDIDRQAVARVQNGELALAGFKATPGIELATEPLPDIFTLYEENIGMLTPMIAEELKEAQTHYPESWLRDAIRKAVDQNKRKWNYIAAILERWSAEGKTDGTYQRDIKKTDPDKYIKGKYGHMVQR